MRKIIENKKIAAALPGLISLALLGGTIALLSGERVYSGNPTGEVPLTMPDTLGQYKGVEIWFCQNASNVCKRVFLPYTADEIIGNPKAIPAADGDNADTAAAGAGEADAAAAAEEIAAEENPAGAAAYICPDCGSPLSLISIGEKKQLPNNTPIFRKLYHTGEDKLNGITATVVFSGIERRSIHKPQVCLESQNSRITHDYPMEFEVANGGVITLRILQIQQTFGPEIHHSVYAYWLFNPELETDSHNERFLRMCIDNAFRKYRPRWGYASMAFQIDSQNPVLWKAKLSDFMRHFYPLITETRKELDAQRHITVRIDGNSSDINTIAPSAAGNTTDRSR